MEGGEAVVIVTYDDTGEAFGGELGWIDGTHVTMEDIGWVE